MPLDPRAKRFLDMTAVMAGADDARPPLAERRKALEKLMQFARADRICREGSDGNYAGTGRLAAYAYSKTGNPAFIGRAVAGLRAASGLRAQPGSLYAVGRARRAAGGDRGPDGDWT